MQKFGGPEARTNAIVYTALRALADGQDPSVVAATAEKTNSEWSATHMANVTKPVVVTSRSENFKSNIDFPSVRQNHVRGTVTAFQSRYESSKIGQVFIWNFRLSPGDGQPITQVEMRGVTFQGNIANGDVVEIPTPTTGQVSKVCLLYNLTSDSEVSAYYPFEAMNDRKPFIIAKRALHFVVVLIVLSIFGLVAGMMFFMNKAVEKNFAQGPSSHPSFPSLPVGPVKIKDICKVNNKIVPCP